jgi:hypothetical protein
MVHTVIIKMKEKKLFKGQQIQLRSTHLILTYKFIAYLTYKFIAYLTYKFIAYLTYKFIAYFRTHMYLNFRL